MRQKREKRKNHQEKEEKKLRRPQFSLPRNRLLKRGGGKKEKKGK